MADSFYFGATELELIPGFHAKTDGRFHVESTGLTISRRDAVTKIFYLRAVINPYS